MGVGLAAVLLIIIGKDIFNQTSAKEVYQILCDSFFAVGVVMAGMGLLVFTSNEGVFDGLIYGVTLFLGMFKKDLTRKYATLYDYKESRASKQLSYGFLLICGVIVLAISAIMYLLYLKNK